MYISHYYIMIYIYIYIVLHYTISKSSPFEEDAKAAQDCAESMRLGTPEMGSTWWENPPKTGWWWLEPWPFKTSHINLKWKIIPTDVRVYFSEG